MEGVVCRATDNTTAANYATIMSVQVHHCLATWLPVSVSKLGAWEKTGGAPA